MIFLKVRVKHQRTGHIERHSMPHPHPDQLLHVLSQTTQTTGQTADRPLGPVRREVPRNRVRFHTHNREQFVRETPRPHLQTFVSFICTQRQVYFDKHAANNKLHAAIVDRNI